jgi:flagellar biosynthesis protein FlhF
MRVSKSRKIRRTAPQAPVIVRRGHGRLRVRRPQAEPVFDLIAIAGRDRVDPGMPEPSWPSGDVAFLTAVLRAQRVPELLVQRIAAAIPAMAAANTTLADRLAEALAVAVDFARLADVTKAPRLLLAGPSGCGKTTLGAKLVAAHGGNTRFISTDVGRVGGVAQLREYASALGVPVDEAASPEALQALVEAHADDALIIDTGGTDPGDDYAWESLRPWVVAADATPLLVLPANAPVEDAIAAGRATGALGGRHVAVTRLDIVRRVGAVLGAAMAGLALAGASVTPHFAYGLRSLTPEVLAQRLLSGALEDERWRAPAA